MITHTHKARTACWWSFVLGALAHSFTHMMTTDLLGLDRYIEAVRVTWIDTHWAMWAFAVVAVAVVQVFHVRGIGK